MKERLIIRRVPKGYVVDFSETHEADKMRKLFGVAVIPSAYTYRADPNDVVKAVQKLNPWYDVVLMPQVGWF